jgi:hypothetical protein
LIGGLFFGANMSIQVMSRVWAEAPYEGGALIVLLALADWADEGGYCFPKVPAIAKKSRLTERQVRNILRNFRKDDTLSIERGGGRGIQNRYRINPEKFSVKSVSLKSEAETLKSTTGNPEICDSGKTGLIREKSTTCGEKPQGNRHYPSIEPSYLSSKPSGSDDTVLRSALQTVWDYYINKVDRDPKIYSFSLPRKRKGLARLRECLSKTNGDVTKAVELMKIAVDSLASSDWHMGRDPKTNGKKYCEWDKHLFASYERMERRWNE